MGEGRGFGTLSLSAGIGEKERDTSFRDFIELFSFLFFSFCKRYPRPTPRYFDDPSPLFLPMTTSSKVRFFRTSIPPRPVRLTHSLPNSSRLASTSALAHSVRRWINTSRARRSSSCIRAGSAPGMMDDVFRLVSRASVRRRSESEVKRPSHQIGCWASWIFGGFF